MERKEAAMIVKKSKPLWQVFPELTNMVRKNHIARGTIGTGHDFLHALMVAQYGELIAETKHVERLAWVAGIIHNTDRIFPEVQVEKQLRYYFAKAVLTDEVLSLVLTDEALIIEAVLNHSKLNDPKDNPVTVTLKDADRLANIGPNLFLRSAQFYHKLPAYDPRYVVNPDPMATYRDPKTVLHDIRCSLEWEDWIRLPKAKELSRPWFKQLRTFVKGFGKQLKEVGLLPYPFPEDFGRLDKQ